MPRRFLQLAVLALAAIPASTAGGKAQPPDAKGTGPCFRPAVSWQDASSRRKMDQSPDFADVLLARSWAMPVAICEPQNVYQLNAALYRGGHVSQRGACHLRALGINTVVSLRLVDRDAKFAARAGFNYVHIPFKTWQPDEDQVVEFLKIAVNPDCQPVYVYCNRGSERTGMMSATYRVVVEGWSKEDAIAEMTEGPFDYHPVWKKVVQFIRCMDVERLRERVGLTKAENP
jgi:tyrosine-protein phosphatase SIW14